MGLITKVTTIMVLSGNGAQRRAAIPGASRRGRPNGPGRRPREPRRKPRRPRPCGPKLRRRWAEEQAAALARALHEDEAHRQADLRQVAEKEAEAVPEWPPSS